MKTIALMQIYNEALFVHAQLSWLIDCTDQIIITEGCLSPFNQPTRSCDNTRNEVKRFIELYDKKGKIKFYNAFAPEPKPHSREGWEGYNKSFMLKKSLTQHGDLIYIADCDEFWDPDRFNSIIKKFKKNDNINHIPICEYQFAYNLKLCFNASHDGRFMRYVNGAKFGTTNHFIHPDGKDITKNYEHLVSRENAQMAHLCWAKHPAFIKQKVESFQRPSFTAWYNNVYLEYPQQKEAVYKVNKRIGPYHGTGFAEGQHEKLYPFNGILPPVLHNMTLNWIPYINTWHKELRI